MSGLGPDPASSLHHHVPDGSRTTRAVSLPESTDTWSSPVPAPTSTTHVGMAVLSPTHAGARPSERTLTGPPKLPPTLVGFGSKPRSTRCVPRTASLPSAI